MLITQYPAMSEKRLRIATRKSPLAIWQANHIRDALIHFWPELKIDLVPMITSGDKFLKDKLLTIGGKGLFVKELEEALLDKRADLAVHSMKDVPAAFPEGLTIAAICDRHNPLDALLSSTYNSLDDLPQGAVIGTSSLRRQSQLLAIRPDLQLKTLRGNIHTRINKMELGEYDAIVLAAAGLERMGLQHNIREIFSDEIMLPACGQGALGIECRTEDEELLRYIAPLNDPLTALCVGIERQVNAQLGGNCHAPLAVYCKATSATELWLRAKVGSIDEQTTISDSQRDLRSNVDELVYNCSDALIKRGAAKLIAMASEL